MRATSLAALAMLGPCCGRTTPSSSVRLAIASAPEALDPRFTTSAVGVRLSQLLAPPLCVVDGDGRARLVLASSLTSASPAPELGPAAGQVVEAKLRRGLRFPDGAAVTASDVVFSFTSMLDPASASPHRPRLIDLERVEQVDDETVRFHLHQPSAPFIVDVVCAVGILQQRTCTDVAACRMNPQGAGAWQLASIGIDRFALTARTAKTDLDIRVMRDGTGRLLALVAGDIDVIAGDVAPWDLLRLPKDVGVFRLPGLGFSYLGLNARRLDDDVRRAIAAAIDVDALIAGRLRGAGARASGLLPGGHWAKDSALLPQARDLEAARRLLAGREVRVSLLVTPDRLRRSVALALRAQLAEAGVVVDIVVRDWSVVYEEMKAGRFDLVLAKWTPVAEPDLLTTVFHSRSIPSGHKPGGNRGGFVDADVDEWLDTARAAGDERERARLYGLVEKRVQERAALVPLWFDDELTLAGPRVQGLLPRRTGSLLSLQDVTVVAVDPAETAP